MADLEERILKQNVPGRYSQWDGGDGGDERPEVDDDADGARADGGDEDPEEAAEAAAREQEEEGKADPGKDVPDHIRAKIHAQRMTESKTGVKGVLADAREHARLAIAQQEVEAAMRRAVLQRMAEGATRPAEASSAALAQALQQVRGEDGKGVEDDDDDDDEEEFMREFRRKRLAELRSSANMPRFGEQREVTPFEFVDAVDHEDPRVMVVVHLFESFEPACTRLNRALEDLARRQPHVKFLRMRAMEAQPDFDAVALPTVVLYRGGEVQQIIPRVTDFIDEACNRDDVEWLLESHGAFERGAPAPSVTAESQQVLAERLAHVARAAGAGEDDDF